MDTQKSFIFLYFSDIWKEIWCKHAFKEFLAGESTNLGGGGSPVLEDLCCGILIMEIRLSPYLKLALIMFHEPWKLVGTELFPTYKSEFNYWYSENYNTCSTFKKTKIKFCIWSHPNIWFNSYIKCVSLARFEHYVTSSS